jgi:hypothetical protein
MLDRSLKKQHRAAWSKHILFQFSSGARAIPRAAWLLPFLFFSVAATAADAPGEIYSAGPEAGERSRPHEFHALCDRRLLKEPL